MRKITAIAFIGFLVGLFLFIPFNFGVVTSDSMEPTIEKGEVFIFQETSNVEIGDIITFYAEDRDKLITHRVISEEAGGYITKGDNNQATDQESGNSLVTEQAIIGKVSLFMGQPLIIPFVSIDHVKFINENMNILISIIIFFLLIDIALDITPKTRHYEIKYTSIATFLFIFLLIVSSLVLYTPISISENIVVNNHHVQNEVKFHSTLELQSLFSNNQYTSQFVSVRGFKDPHLVSNGSTVDIIHGPYNKIGPINSEIHVYSYPNLYPPTFMEALYNTNPLLLAIMIPLPYLLITYLISIVLLPSNEKVKVPEVRSIKQVLK